MADQKPVTHDDIEHLQAEAYRAIVQSKVWERRVAELEQQIVQATLAMQQQPSKE